MKLIRIATEAIECTLHNAHTHIHTCTRTVYQSTKAELSSKTTEKRIKRNSDDFRLMSKDLLVDRWSFRNELEWKMPVCIRTVACVCVCVRVWIAYGHRQSIEFVSNASQTIWFRLLPHTIFIHIHRVQSSAVWWVYWTGLICMRFVGS